MVGVPAATPVIIPDVDPALAHAVLLLLQVPPAGVEFKVVVNPAHTVVVPVIAVGSAFTVKEDVLMQPVDGIV